MAEKPNKEPAQANEKPVDLVVENPAQEDVTPAPVDRLALNEFCRRLSERERRYTLISGFHHAMTKAGRLSDTAENYSAAFADFTKRPV